MKKLLLSLAILGMSAMANAQIFDDLMMPPFNIGITAGVNVPTFGARNYDYTIGWYLGADIIIDASEIITDTHLRIQPRYSMKGATGPEILDLSGQEPGYKMYYTTNYIEVPIHYGYAVTLDDDWSLLAETGPYLAIGLGGKAREKGQLRSDSHTFFKYYDANRLDIGWGVEFSLLYAQTVLFNIGYDWGFRNVTPQFKENCNFNLGVSYLF